MEDIVFTDSLRVHTYEYTYLYINFTMSPAMYLDKRMQSRSECTRRSISSGWISRILTSLIASRFRFKDEDDDDDDVRERRGDVRIFFVDFKTPLMDGRWGEGVHWNTWFLPEDSFTLVLEISLLTFFNLLCRCWIRANVRSIRHSIQMLGKLMNTYLIWK